MTIETDATRRRTALARQKLLGILSGTWIAQGIYALVKLGVPDLLAAGPRSAEELAQACVADAHALGRLLRALTLLGLFSQPEPGRYALTPTTELLRADVPDSVRLNVLMQGEEIFQSFGEIMHTLHTGRPAFEKVYGLPFYDYLGENPQAAYTFNESMGNEPAPAAIAGADLSGVALIVDVGGGNGSLLVDVLRREPGVRAILVDLAEAVQLAQERFAREGLSDRVECVEGSFFTEIPAGGDLYVLSRVLHNWADHNALAILRTVRAAMKRGARLLVLEDVLPEGDETPASRSAAGLVDLLMLVTLEGCDRTASQYRDLLAQAGLEVRPAAPGLIEAVHP